MINFSFEKENSIEYFKLSRIQNWLSNVILSEGKVEGEISYIICSDSFLHSINLKYLDHDTYTDIISFPTSNNKKIISGEIFISIDRVIENSFVNKTDIYSEVHRVIVHGVLHFIGYNDSTDEEKKIMRAKEDYYLNLLPLN